MLELQVICHRKYFCRKVKLQLKLAQVLRSVSPSDNLHICAADKGHLNSQALMISTQPLMSQAPNAWQISERLRTWQLSVFKATYLTQVNLTRHESKRQGKLTVNYAKAKFKWVAMANGSNSLQTLQTQQQYLVKGILCVIRLTSGEGIFKITCNNTGKNEAAANRSNHNNIITTYWLDNNNNRSATTFTIQ